MAEPCRGAAAANACRSSEAPHRRGLGGCSLPLNAPSLWEVAGRGFGFLCQDSGVVRARQYEKERGHILRLCRDISCDSVGIIALEDLVDAFDSNEELASFFSVMDIHREDLSAVYGLFRVNGYTDISCHELVEQLLSLKMLSPQRMLLYLSSIIQHEIEEGIKSMTGSTVRASGSQPKLVPRSPAAAMDRCSTPPPLAPRRAVGSDDSTDGIAHEATTPRISVAEERLRSTSRFQVQEDRVQKCLDRLQHSVEEELSSIAHAVAASFHEAASSRAPPPVPSSLPMTGTAPDPASAFSVIDELPPIASSRKGMQESARRQNMVSLAEQVQKDLLKFQNCINKHSSAAADKLGGDYPDDPICREYQVALVQLQLHLNEGLSGTMTDIMTKIHPAAQNEDIEALKELMTLPPSVHKQENRAGRHCGTDMPSRPGPCCGGRLVLVGNDAPD